MNNIKLSYIITTRNKLPFLQHVMKRLLENVQADEEIIVIDAASTDGQRKYLEELYKTGKIHQFISEPDKGEAHGYNKGLLMARGELIKLITDDDAFYYPGIQACKKFMLEHPDVDVLATEGAGTDWSIPDPFGASEYYRDFEQWKSETKSFGFCGLGLMLRRLSLPLLGMFHTGIVRVDHEFSLRVTSSHANLAWYTGYCWVRIINPSSNTSLQCECVMNEGERLEQFYLGKKPQKRTVLQRTYLTIKKFGRPIKKMLINNNSHAQNNYFPRDWMGTFELCDDWLTKQNERLPGQFLFRQNSEQTGKVND